MKAHNRDKKLVKGIGGYYYAHSTKNTLRGVVGVNALILLSVLTSSVFGSYMQPSEQIISPYVKPYTIEPIIEAKVSPKTTEQIILEVFGENGEEAIKIATCESGMKPDRIGDTHIMGVLDGQTIGDSVGLFQIRTGDSGVYDSKPWNRAKANGMTVEEFRTYLKDPENNAKYAKDIFDRQGWSAWYNCMNKVL